MNKKSVCIVGPCALPKNRKHFRNLFDLMIFVDGGVRHRKALLSCFRKNSYQSLSVGDEDSGGSDLDIKLNPNKNFSDLAYALRLIPNEVTVIQYFGFFPKLKSEARLDHLLMNYGEIFRFAKKSFSKKTIHLLSENTLMLSQKKNLLNIIGLFSIFTFEDTVLKISGKAQYKLLKPKKIKAFSSETLSNYGFGQIEIQVDRPVLIILSQQDFSKVEIQRLITGL